MPLYSTAKKRTGRIDHRYTGQTDTVRTARGRLGWLCAGAAFAYIVAAFAIPNFGASQFTHGPVSAAHATWENQCEVCHEPFTPIRADSWGAGLSSNWLASWTGGGKASDATSAGGSGGRSEQRWGLVSNRKCQVCHAQTDHHPAHELAVDAASCASCHHEHRGRTAPIARSSDAGCLACHDNLKDHWQPGPKSPGSSGDGQPSGQSIYANHVGQFPDDHPEFRSLEKDPGTLVRFSHAQHLATGLFVKGSKTRPWMWSDVAPGSSIRMPAGSEATDPVKLDCGACHQPEGANAGGTGAGHAMAPISFEQHCQACHGRDLPLGIPHAASPAIIDQVVAARHWSDLILRSPATAKAAIEHPIPGLGVDRDGATVESSIESARHKGRVIVQEACAACHRMKSTGPLAAIEVEPANVPAVWFKSAWFSHAAHSGVACAECHGQANRSTDPADVLIAGRETCAECHRESGWTNWLTATEGSARADCAECHRYHNRDEILVEGTSPKKGRTISEFLGKTSGGEEKMPAAAAQKPGPQPLGRESSSPAAPPPSSPGEPPPAESR
jgi:hypothetical protein